MFSTSSVGGERGQGTQPAHRPGDLLHDWVLHRVSQSRGCSANRLLDTHPRLLIPAHMALVGAARRLASACKWVSLLVSDRVCLQATVATPARCACKRLLLLLCLQVNVATTARMCLQVPVTACLRLPPLVHHFDHLALLTFAYTCLSLLTLTLRATECGYCPTTRL